MTENTQVHPFICCVSCAGVTKEWSWVENPNNGEIYGVCNKCEKQVKKRGINMFAPS